MTVSNWSATLRRGAFAGLALLFVLPAGADESLHQAVRKQMRDQNYVLVEGHGGARLYVLAPDDSGYSTVLLHQDPDRTSEALARTQSVDSRMRVRGLTELAGDASEEALNAALVLLSDPSAAVREEAVHLIFDHPHADTYSMLAVVRDDPSLRVREALDDLLDEDLADEVEED